MKITGNEPAMPITSTHGFPTHLKNLNIDGTGAIGLTIRQQFAMAAMQGMCANSDVVQAAANIGIKNNKNWLEIIVCDAVLVSDTLIAELNRKEE